MSRGAQMSSVVRATGDQMRFLSLAEAGARTFYQVTGAVASDDEPVLSGVAHALSNLIPIYVQDGPNVAPREVTPCELLLAEFSDSGRVLALRNGTQLSPLVVRSSDLKDAVIVLRSVKAWFALRANLRPGRSPQGFRR